MISIYLITKVAFHIIYEGPGSKKRRNLSFCACFPEGMIFRYCVLFRNKE